MKIVITGAAGFIGAATAKALLQRGEIILGIDNLNDYYDVSLKKARLEALQRYTNFSFQQIDIKNALELHSIIETFQPQKILHLAAQAGVRYSLENPQQYIDSNIVGFANILECCRQHNITHCVFASSSSVYGNNSKLPYSVDDNVDSPVSLYAATKKSNELMAHAYHHLYQFPLTGLRYFTVYGPWGRPDMAPIKFALKIMRDETIQIYNHGEHSRDFTYIDDIVAGTIKVLDNPSHYKIYNIGRGEPVALLDFIQLLEKYLGKAAKKEFLPKQPGDVDHTWADTTALEKDVNYKPSINLEEGIARFAEWFKRYYFN